MAERPDDGKVDRRKVLMGLAAAGTVLPLATAAEVHPGGDPAACARTVGLELTDSELALMEGRVRELREAFAKLRAVPLDNAVPPALRFTPLQQPPAPVEPAPAAAPALPAVPADLEELAFLPAATLGALLRARSVTSVALTEMYLRRLERLDPTLHCVVTLTRERALAQARQADRELDANQVRSPLHGVPWGIKDLFAVAGYPTTWGAEPYRDQVLAEDATVVRRLDEAGAVLVAKLSLGALAMGDVWFGGRTRNPWNPEEGSSGSSAGAAAAVAAGLVGFAVGTETRGSIVSPCTRCGATGLRPTFGRISRHGAMALAWSMDKVGPIARSVGDCALVFDLIRGADGHDDVVDPPFAFDPAGDVRALRVGVLRGAFEGAPAEEAREWRANDLAALETLRGLGVGLTPVGLPDLPVDALSFILSAEAAAAFDELTRSGRDDLLTRQDADAWPNIFRAARLIPAVEYIQANRVRTLLQRETERSLAGIDVLVAPTFGNDVLRLSNLTGHPAVVVPNGFRANGTPTSITFTGRLYGEAAALLLAKRYQDATGFHLRRPSVAATRG